MSTKHIFILTIVLVFSFCTVNVIQASTVSPAVEYEEKTFSIGTKSIDTNIAIVDLSNPDIRLTAFITGNSIGETVKLEKIVQDEDPVLVISAGVIDYKNPKGNFMSDGEFIFTTSGHTSMGITEKNKPVFGKPMIFTKLYTSDNEQKRTLSWAIRDINSLEQTGEQSVLYTPAHGTTLDITSPGWTLIIENSITTGFYRVEPGRHINIPVNGCVVYFSDKFSNTIYFTPPEIGRSVSMAHSPVSTDGSSFPLDDMRQIVSGSTRLLDGSKLNSQFLEQSNSNAVTARSAVGALPDGRLIFAYAENVNQDELAEIMLKSGCSDAISLLDGSRCALYVNGSYITPSTANIAAAIVISKNR